MFPLMHFDEEEKGESPEPLHFGELVTLGGTPESELPSSCFCLAPLGSQLLTSGDKAARSKLCCSLLETAGNCTVHMDTNCLHMEDEGEASFVNQWIPGDRILQTQNISLDTP